MFNKSSHQINTSNRLLDIIGLSVFSNRRWLKDRIHRGIRVTADLISSKCLVGMSVVDRRMLSGEQSSEILQECKSGTIYTENSPKPDWLLSEGELFLP
jgi:hypothetical protein